MTRAYSTTTHKKRSAISTAEKAGYRIGLYIRVSTEEQASNPEGSIKNQEELLRATVKLKNMDGGNYGEIVDLFIDRGRSGKDTNRAELQRLLGAIEEGKVNLLMVSDLSRLSRSIKDFSQIWEMMQHHGCQLTSLRENFDTTTAAGEMVLFTLANLSQFERKQVAERVVASIQSRASRGLYNGGVVPLGYCINPDRRGYLAIDNAQAATVKKAFSVFLLEQNLTATAKWLNENGYGYKRKTEGGGNAPRLGHFTVQNLHNILKNKAYVGIKTYKVRKETIEATAVWEPIIEPTVFEKAQELLAKNNKRKPDSPTRYPFELTGVLMCGTCGERLCGKTANGNGGKIPYYEHGWATKRQACLVKKVFDCSPNRINGRVIEPLVWKKVEELLKNKELVLDLIAEATNAHGDKNHQQDVDRIKNKIYSINSQIEALTERLAQLPKSVPADSIFQAMEKLTYAKKEEELRIEQLQSQGTSQELPVDLKTYESFLEAIKKISNDPALHDFRTRIIHMLVKKIEVFPSTFKLYFYVGHTYIKREIATVGSLPCLNNKTAENSGESAEKGQKKAPRRCFLICQRLVRTA